MARHRQHRRLTRRGIPNAVGLDATALSAAAVGLARIRAELTLAEELGVEIYVSSVTLTETLRGRRRDSRVHAVLWVTDPRPVTPQLGRAL